MEHPSGTQWMVKEFNVSYIPGQLCVLIRHECRWHKVMARNPRSGLVEEVQCYVNDPL